LRASAGQRAPHVTAGREDGRGTCGVDPMKGVRRDDDRDRQRRALRLARAASPCFRSFSSARGLQPPTGPAVRRSGGERDGGREKDRSRSEWDREKDRERERERERGRERDRVRLPPGGGVRSPLRCSVGPRSHAQRPCPPYAPCPPQGRERDDREKRRSRSRDGERRDERDKHREERDKHREHRHRSRSPDRRGGRSRDRSHSRDRRR